MNNVLHITSGDFVGESLKRSGLPGEVLVWHDILYDGPRQPGWPSDEDLVARAHFLEDFTGGGMSRQQVLETLVAQYQRLKAAAHVLPPCQLVLWFDSCLFDQSMLAHLLVLLDHLGRHDVELLSIAAFPGIEPFDGLGQLNSYQLASLYGRRQRVTGSQFRYAQFADKAFALQESELLKELAGATTAPLPRIPAAVTRWLEELPSADSGLGKLEKLALEAMAEGNATPGEIFTAVAEKDSHPQYWGDITLWSKINGLADRQPPLVKIEGPAARLPQWQSDLNWKEFTLFSLMDR